MAGWTQIRGTPVVLARDNVDTDQLIPARFMSVPRSEGYGSYLMHDLRRDDTGEPLAGFPLNAAPEANILIAGRNFGSGSSREAAVYALVDAGFRAVIAPSFGDIFASNAVNNGLLPALVSDADAGRVIQHLEAAPSDVEIDLSTRRITLGTVHIDFGLQDGWQTKLINGWDDIDLTLHHAAEIAAYRAARHSTARWAWPAAPD